jgi:Pyruvate/2-oxoacid:ferredoxin oxidoreductase gamma subunit
MMTGIGGQGVQLAARVLALAAVAEGRQVQLFGSYGGMMRGGNTDTTLIVADTPIVSPPTIATTWSAILVHPEFAEVVWPRLQPGGVALVNSSVAGWETSTEAQVIAVPASDIAIDTGNPMAVSMVLVGAYAGATGLVSLASLADAVGQALPSYRAKHIDLSVAALNAGAAAVVPGSAPAWADLPSGAGVMP